MHSTVYTSYIEDICCIVVVRTHGSRLAHELTATANYIRYNVQEPLCVIRELIHRQQWKTQYSRMHTDRLSAQSQTQEECPIPWFAFHTYYDYYHHNAWSWSRPFTVYLFASFFFMNYTHTNDSRFVFCTMTLTLIVSTQYKIEKKIKTLSLCSRRLI